MKHNAKEYLKEIIKKFIIRTQIKHISSKNVFFRSA
jgi:hypothetical protein